jgi:hypothetical protein
MIGGSSGNIVIDGITYPVHADADLTKLPKFETEYVATSGESVEKRTRKDESIEAIDVAVNPLQNEQLENQSYSRAGLPCAVEFPDGSIYKCKGRVKLEGYTSQDQKQTVTITPTSWEDGWTLFAG